MSLYKYGWLPSHPDHRDFTYERLVHALLVVPDKVDLRDKMPPIYDQGQLGSCTANAINGAFEYDLKKQNLADFMPSRLFLYYNERALEGTIKSDSGAMIRDGMKVLAKQGVCYESTWPYDIAKFAKKPTTKAYREATKHRGLQYVSVKQDLNQMQQLLAAGFPIVIGFSVYDYFESQEMANTGILKLPQPGENMLGGHAVLIVGYDNATQMFLVRNSWGSNWGQAGYFWMPFQYALNPNLANDFWALQSVTS